MHRTSTVMAKNHKGEQKSKSDRRHHEEIYGDQVLGVILEKGSPRLGGRLAVPDHVLGDSRLRHLNAEFQEFAMNARRSPARIGEAHFPDEIPNFIGCRRSSFNMATLPIPIQSEALRCHAMTVSVLTRSNADRQSFHNCESQTHRTRSAQLRCNLCPRLERCRTKS